MVLSFVSYRFSGPFDYASVFALQSLNSFIRFALFSWYVNRLQCAYHPVNFLIPVRVISCTVLQQLNLLDIYA